MNAWEINFDGLVGRRIITRACRLVMKPLPVTVFGV